MGGWGLNNYNNALLGRGTLLRYSMYRSTIGTLLASGRFKLKPRNIAMIRFLSWFMPPERTSIPIVEKLWLFELHNGVWNLDGAFPDMDPPAPSQRETAEQSSGKRRS